jgi:hypothetical protein
MLREDITAQVRNVYLDVFVSDQSGVPIPAKAIIDTGAEVTFVREEFAKAYLIVKGGDQAGEGSEIVHSGTMFFGRDLELAVPDIEFRLRRTLTAQQFSIALRDFTAQLVRRDIDIIAGMDILESLDFCYFHTVAKGEKRTFVSIGPAGRATKLWNEE